MLTHTHTRTNLQPSLASHCCRSSLLLPQQRGTRVRVSLTAHAPFKGKKKPTAGSKNALTLTDTHSQTHRHLLYGTHANENTDLRQVYHAHHPR